VLFCPTRTTLTHLLIHLHLIQPPMPLYCQLKSISKHFKDEIDLRNCKDLLTILLDSIYSLVDLVNLRFGFITMNREHYHINSNQFEFLITERYVNKIAYTEAHRSSPEFLEFKKKITDMNSESNSDTFGWSLHGQSYNELDAGFM
jgi:hypothetical protein